MGGGVKWCEEAFERLGAVVGQVGASGGTGLLGDYSHYPAVALQHNVLPLCSGFTARGLGLGAMSTIISIAPPSSSLR